ncbi:MAG: thiamine diphosphokinase [Oscillospiraceae bacterium]|nr:thiamine diphosphokinase [Oscillospiraceae bacterium]
MRAVIIGNGTINNYDYIKSRLKSSDFIICADGGIRHAKAMGITPDIAIGDFDSHYREPGIKIYEYPTDKDFTDGELAVSYAKEHGYDEIMLLGMTGDRLDHTLTDIFIMQSYPGSFLVDDKNEIHIIKDKLIIDGCKGKTLSIIPVYGDLTGITTKGLRWQLDNETLYFGTSRGNSNIIENNICEISVKSGVGIIIINNGE